MKTRFLYSLLALGILSIAAPRAQAQADFAFINLDQAFDGYYKTKLADEQLKAQATQFNEERAEMMEEYEGLQGEFNAAREDAQNTALSEEVRNERRNQAEEKLIEIREFESNLRRFDQERRGQLKEQSDRMRSRIVEEIREVIEDFVRNQGYTAVIDTSGQSLNGVPMIIYSDPNLDITEQIIELINKGKTTAE